MITLIAPPPLAPVYPYLSVPTLTGFLRSKGYKVYQEDLNLKCWNKLVTKDNIKKSYFLLDENESKRAFWLKTKTSNIHNEIEDSLLVLKGERKIFSADDYFYASLVIRKALNLISYRYNSNWTVEKYYFENNIKNSADAILMAENQDNVFEPVFLEVAKEIVNNNKSKIVGISISFESQLIPSISFARVLKKINPNIYIVFGGSYITHLHLNAKNLLNNCEYINGIVLYQGEQPLKQIIDIHLNNKKDFNEVVNYIWKNENNKVICNPLDDKLIVNDTFSPDFSDYKFSDYLSPLKTVPILGARGCYYGKCVFCTHKFSAGNKYTHRDINIILNEISQHYMNGIECFYLADSAVSPLLMIKLAKMVKEYNLDLIWLAETIPVPILGEKADELWKGGCKLLSFGLESVNQNTLNLMNKNNNIKSTFKVLNQIHNAGITTAVTTMVGFPGETKEEARKTLEFLINSKDIDLFGVSRFGLLKNSPISFNLHKYDIAIFDQTEEDLNLIYNFKSSNGISQKDSINMVDNFFLNTPEIWEHKRKLELALSRAHFSIFNRDDVSFQKRIKI